MSKVIWKRVPGMSSSIRVSNTGEVKEDIFQGGSRIVPQTRSGKYLSISYRGCTYPVHKLVAFAFLGKNDDKTVVYHKDGNIDNNNVDNLYVCTRSEYISKITKNKKNDMIFCKEISTFFVTLLSASIYTHIPETLIKYSIDHNVTVFGRTFSTSDLIEGCPVIHVDIHEAVDKSKSLKSIEDYKNFETVGGVDATFKLK